MDDETRGADSADTGGTDGTEAHDTDGAGLREPRTTDAHKTPSGPHDAHRAGTGAHAPDSRQARWEARMEVPLGVASLAFLTAYALRVLAPLRNAALDLCLAVTLAAWALFAVDYAVRWHLSGQRLRFVRTHVLDTVVLFLPLLRRSGS